MIQYGVHQRFYDFAVQVNGKWWEIKGEPAAGTIVLREYGAAEHSDFRRLEPKEFDMVLNHDGRLTTGGARIEVGEEFAIMVRISEIFGFPVLNPRPALVAGVIGALGEKKKDDYLPNALMMTRLKGEAVPQPRRRRRHWVSNGAAKPNATKEVVTVCREGRRGELLSTQKVQLSATGHPGMLVSQIMKTLCRAESAACAVARMVARGAGHIEVLPDGTARRAT